MYTMNVFLYFKVVAVAWITTCNRCFKHLKDDFYIKKEINSTRRKPERLVRLKMKWSKSLVMNDEISGLH